MIKTTYSSDNQISLRDDIILAELSTGGQTPPLICEALVGPCLEFEVKVGGVGTKALIDSGSQITVLSQSWVENKLIQ